MPEFARALILPDLSPPRREEILSLLLIWESVELETTQVGKDPTKGLDWANELEEAGALRVTNRPFDPEHPPESRRLFEEEWQELAEHVDVLREIFDPRKSVKPAAQAVTDGLVANVQQAVARAGREGLAPVAATYHASLAASLPEAEVNAPVREATLIDVATRGIKVSPDTSTEAVLAFREKNAPLIGRFRASLIDLAASVDPNSPAPAEEAFALVKNRIEPALSALDDVLSRGRINFAWSMLLGASTTLAVNFDAGAAVTEAGQVVTRGIRYAFNRDHLIRDHPYGFLYRARNDFGADAARPTPVITDPEREIREWFEMVVGAAVETVVKASEEGRVDSTRLLGVLHRASENE
jgi:hypothetical protein